MSDNNCAIFCFCTGAYDCQYKVKAPAGDSRSCAWLGFNNNRCDCSPAQLEEAKQFIKENSDASK